MKECWAVVVTGPAGVGKTQAALEALRSVWGDAIVVCPGDADGLATILTGQRQFVRAITDRMARVAPERSGRVAQGKDWIRRVKGWLHRRWLRLRKTSAGPVQDPRAPSRTSSRVAGRIGATFRGRWERAAHWEHGVELRGQARFIDDAAVLGGAPAEPSLHVAALESFGIVPFEPWLLPRTAPASRPARTTLSIK